MIEEPTAERGETRVWTDEPHDFAPYSQLFTRDAVVERSRVGGMIDWSGRKSGPFDKKSHVRGTIRPKLLRAWLAALVSFGRFAVVAVVRFESGSRCRKFRVVLPVSTFSRKSRPPTATGLARQGPASFQRP